MSSKRTHTEGPWERRSDLPYTSHGIVIFHGRFKDNRTICRLREGTAEEREANAHLIAAAPDLYDALEAIVESACDGRSIPEWLEERLVAAKAALLKVGEARNGD